MTYEIVGLVGDAKYADLREAPAAHGLSERVPGGTRQVLANLRFAPTRSGEVAEQVRAAVRHAEEGAGRESEDAGRTGGRLDRHLERVMAILDAGFGGLGAALAALGLYGLLAYTVARRTTRSAFAWRSGRPERDVTRMVLNNALRLVCAGVVLGAPIAFWSERFAANLIVNLRVGPVFPVAVAAAAMIVVALLAAYVPARRAARVHPMEALRHS